MQGKLICAKLTLVLITLATVTAWAQPAYLPGGPLAGLDLPPNPRNSPSRGVPYGEVELYPGSVEHWRDYWMKYCPNRSMFDAQSLVRRWPATELAKAAGITTEMYAEPVFAVGRDSTGSATGETRPPVPVVRGKIGSSYKLDLGTLDVGMYCLRIIG